MTDAEQRLLRALALMSEQYLSNNSRLDHTHMSAGEAALKELFAYGLVDSADRGAAWTKAGRDLLDDG